MKKLFVIFFTSMLVFSALVSCESNTVQVSDDTRSTTCESDNDTAETVNDADSFNETHEIYGTYSRPNDGDRQVLIDSFTITLGPDGTYFYYETFISSHIGWGLYTVDGNIITLIDDDIPSLEGSLTYTYNFEFRDGKLIYLASKSDRFMYVNLPDGAEFERVNTAEIETKK